MTHPVIDFGECSGCGSCMDVCPNQVLDIVDDCISIVDEDACVACGSCVDECPMGAIADLSEW